MENSGNCGRAGAHREDPDLLKGVLASEHARVVYPEDRCLECEREGKLTADEKCFHRHWRVADEEMKREIR